MFFPPVRTRRLTSIYRAFVGSLNNGTEVYREKFRQGPSETRPGAKGNIAGTFSLSASETPLDALRINWRYRAASGALRAYFFAAFAAEGFGLSAAINSARGSVLITSFFSIQPRRAVITPYFINGKCVVE